MKTYKGWNDSGKELDKYLQKGDEVDEEMYWYFVEVLPPATLRSNIVQIGEPSSHNTQGQPEFDTLEKINNKWVYTGIRIAA